MSDTPVIPFIQRLSHRAILLFEDADFCSSSLLPFHTNGETNFEVECCEPEERSSSVESEERSLSDTSATCADEEEVQHDKPSSGQDKDDTARQSVSMSAKRQFAAPNRSWVSLIYSNSVEIFEDEGDEWIIGEPVCEDKEQEYDDYSTYARGIFRCTRIVDGNTETAIMKIYLQGVIRYEVYYRC